MFKNIFLVLVSLIPAALAETATFQNGANGYGGYRQMVLQANFEERRTADLSQRTELKAVGVPHGGEKTMFVLRFDDLGIPENAKIQNAMLELYQISENSNSEGFETIPAANRVIHVHRMLTPFYSDGSEGYSCSSYRRYGGSGEELYWGDQHRITDGPVKGIDYDRTPIGQIPMEPGASGLWYSVDVTEAIVKAREEGSKDGGHGFLIMSPHYWYGLTFASGEFSDPDLRPRLIINYN